MTTRNVDGDALNFNDFNTLSVSFPNKSSLFNSDA